MNFFKTLGRMVLGATYACIPIFGWMALSKSFKRVNPGEISILTQLDGNFEILEPGFYFRPGIGDRFGESKSINDDFIDLGPVKRVRIRTFQKGVKNVNGRYEILEPGIHFVDSRKGEIIDKDKDIVNINSTNYRLGEKHYVVIRNGEIGESYNKGKLVPLQPGDYELPPGHIFVAPHNTNQDIIRLGEAMVIVTVKEGQVAIINGKKGVEMLGPGKHAIKQEEGNFFQDIISTIPQVINLPDMTVTCADLMAVNAKSVLMFQIKDPLKIVGRGLKQVETDLQLYAEGTLRDILRSHKFNELSLPPSLKKDDPSQDRAKLLREIHEKFVADLTVKVAQWGIEIIDLNFTQLMPADKDLHKQICDAGKKQVEQENEKVLAQRRKEIAEINATAEEARVTAADIEKREAKVRAETDVQTAELKAEAAYKLEVRAAEAKAEAINKIASAECTRLTKLGQVADGFKSEIAKQLALLERKGDVLKNIKGAIFVQPDLGETHFWNQEGNSTTFFRTHSNERKTQSSNIADWLALETADRTRRLPGIKVSA